MSSLKEGGHAPNVEEDIKNEGDRFSPEQLGSVDQSFVGRTEVNGIKVVVEWDNGYGDYVVYLPQIHLPEAHRRGISDQLMRVTRRADVAKQIWDYTIEQAKTAKDVYGLFKKVEAFSRDLPYDYDEE